MPIKKEAEHPFLLSGCTVNDGTGRMLVTAVGFNTEWGRTLDKVQGGDDGNSFLHFALNLSHASHTYAHTSFQTEPMAYLLRRYDLHTHTLAHAYVHVTL